MSRAPSLETQIKTLKRELKYQREDARVESNSAIKFERLYKKAESERKEWQDRFDFLLRRDEGRE